MTMGFRNQQLINANPLLKSTPDIELLKLLEKNNSVPPFDDDTEKL